MIKLLDIVVLVVLFSLPAFPTSNAEETNISNQVDPATKFMTRQLNEQADSILVKLDSANANITRAIKHVNDF